MKPFMQTTSFVVGAIVLAALGCQPAIVTTPDSVVRQPLKTDLGLAGDWKVAESPASSLDVEEVMRVEGPDGQGVYTVTAVHPKSARASIGFRVVMEPVPGHGDFWLVQATRITAAEPAERANHIVYAAMRDEHLFLGQIDYTKLRNQLAKKRIDASFDASWPFGSISAEEGRLREVLCDDPRLFVEHRTVYCRPE